MADVSELVFPDNIRVAFECAEKQFRQIKPELTVLVMQTERHSACVTTVKEYDTGYNLYYIPVKPLLDFLKEKKKIQVANILLSIFCWLKNIAKIPYYKDDDCRLYYRYEMIAEWISEEREYEDDEYYFDQLSQLKAAYHFGDVASRKISHSYHIQSFENRLNNFCPRSEWEMQLYELAQRAFNLYTKYPSGSLQNCFIEGLIEPSAEYRLSPDEYISFVWELDGTVTDSIIDSVNLDSQETTAGDYPLAIQLFDTPQSEEHLDLSFETALFDLVDDLIYVLSHQHPINPQSHQPYKPYD